jgi:hypothetical protein
LIGKKLWNFYDLQVPKYTSADFRKIQGADNKAKCLQLDGIGELQVLCCIESWRETMYVLAHMYQST